MKKLGLCVFNVLAFLAVLGQERVEIAGAEGKSYFLQTDWGKVYYEVYGEGDPLLILHGNGGSAKGRHHMVPDLMENYQVILMDARCHGKSDCTDKDLDYFEMAEDVRFLMTHLDHQKYTIWGHSDGGIVGLILGYTVTAKIDRMLISGANTSLKGLEPILVKMMEPYEQLQNPIMKKHFKLMVTQKEIPMDSLKQVEVPVLLMVGDRDAVTLEHTMDIFKALPMSNLCVLPASSHFIGNEKPNHILYWLKEFRKPFSKPSTIEIAQQMAKSLFPED